MSICLQLYLALSITIFLLSFYSFVSEGDLSFEALITIVGSTLLSPLIWAIIIFAAIVGIKEEIKGRLRK